MGKVYAAILAGGSGTRMGNPDKPKQFWDLGDRPVIAHTVEKFCLVSEFDEVIVLAPATWVNQTRDIMARWLAPYADRIAVVAGGAERNDTIMCAIAHIEQVHGLADDDIIVTHDAVRPFVNYRIISDNIAAARKFGACDTVVPATDTIVHSADGQTIAAIPNRAEYYQGQTPQSFNAARLKALFEELADDDKALLTDACKILVLRGEPVALVRGDVANMKLTYTADMRVARALMDEDGAGNGGGAHA
ncbi:MAG TPA: 2-C-methyl-D-erythritol 4-phosphate cytidylyltransferase [Eggerthellaceae bacterium]|nr:2-C-methyl-D-erythritol 4-phosphate cytidylyltransferase [Eggerthellaceae bacterium]